MRRDAAVSAPFSWPNSLTHAPGFERSEAHLLALSLIDAIDTGTEVWSARAARLIQLVPADGCLRWADNDADAELIALGLLALRPADDLPNSAVARQRLAACLSGLQRPGGDFGSSTATSLSVLALETVIGTSPAQTTAARAHLSALQRADGSWGSVRATALAIRALTGGAPDWSNRLSLSSGEVFSSEQVTASLEVRNVAGVPAPTSSWEVRALGQNGSIVALGSGLVPPLASGATVTIPTVFATSALSGPYRIEARIDPFQLQPELDRTNNVASAPLNVVAADDLAITSQGITFSPGTTSATATVSATVRNLGRTVQTAARVEVWKGSPSNGSSLGSFFIPIGLATNATFTGSVQLPLAGLGPVTAISVDVDADDALSEVDESNNRAFRYFEGGAQAPVDLALTEPQPDLPSLVFANAPFQLPVVVKNLSSNDARRVLVRALDAAGTSVGQAEVELVQATVKRLSRFRSRSRPRARFSWSSIRSSN